MDRARALAASRDEARRLVGQAVSEVAPSRRDFAQYVAVGKEDLAVLARLSREAGQRTIAELIEYARACDDAEVAALAVATGPGGLTADEMAAIAAAVTAPILRDHFIVDPSQLYFARLHGADAAVFPAADLDPTTLHALVTVASSLHMASIIEVTSAADIDRVTQLPHVICGLRCTTADGGLDLERTQQLARQVSSHYAAIALPEITSTAEGTALYGFCDAVVAGELLLGGDVTATLEELRAPQRR